MYNQNTLIEYLSSPAGINKIIFGIIIIAIINFIFILYSVRKTYGEAVKEKENKILQKQKIDKLFPK